MYMRHAAGTVMAHTKVSFHMINVLRHSKAGVLGSVLLLGFLFAVWLTIFIDLSTQSVDRIALTWIIVAVLLFMTIESAWKLRTVYTSMRSMLYSTIRRQISHPISTLLTVATTVLFYLIFVAGLADTQVHFTTDGLPVSTVAWLRAFSALTFTFCVLAPRTIIRYVSDRYGQTTISTTGGRQTVDSVVDAETTPPASQRPASGSRTKVGFWARAFQGILGWIVLIYFETVAMFGFAQLFLPATFHVQNHVVIPFWVIGGVASIALFIMAFGVWRSSNPSYASDHKLVMLHIALAVAFIYIPTSIMFIGVVQFTAVTGLANALLGCTSAVIFAGSISAMIPMNEASTAARTPILSLKVSS